jgi:hypothetical protein
MLLHLVKFWINFLTESLKQVINEGALARFINSSMHETCFNWALILPN